LQSKKPDQVLNEAQKKKLEEEKKKKDVQDAKA